MRTRSLALCLLLVAGPARAGTPTPWEMVAVVQDKYLLDSSLHSLPVLHFATRQACMAAGLSIIGSKSHQLVPGGSGAQQDDGVFQFWCVNDGTAP